jgi:oligosaccharide repeat unit polymerase
MFINVLLLFLTAMLLMVGVGLFDKDYLGPLAIYSYFAGLTFILRPALLLLGFDSIRVPFLLFGDYVELSRLALLVFCGGHLILLCAYLLSQPVAKAVGRQWVRFERPLASGRVAAVTVSLTFFSVFLYVFFLWSTGGFEQIIRHLRTGIPITSIDYILLIIPSTTVYVSGLLYVILRKHHQKKHRYLGTILVIINMAIILLLGDRSDVVTPMVVIFLAIHHSVHRLPMRRLILLVLIIVVGLTFLGQIRSYVLFEDYLSMEHFLDFQQNSTQSTVNELVNGLNLIRFDAFLVVLGDTFYGNNYRNGEDFKNGVLGLIPRAVWPQKPVNINPGNWFTMHYFPWKSAGLPFTTLGVWWLNFGYVGVFVGMVLTGIVLRVLREFVDSSKTTYAAFLYGILIMKVFLAGVNSLVLVQLVKTLLPWVIIYPMMLQRSGQLYKINRVGDSSYTSRQFSIHGG